MSWLSGPALFLAVAASVGCDAAPERVAEARAASQPTCVTLQRGVYGEVIDARLRSDQPDTNFGATDSFVTGNQNTQRIALLGFQLAPIPAGATVQSATVSLHEMQNLGPSTIDVHVVTTGWHESTVTWNSFASAYAPAVATSFSNQGSGYAGPVSFDVTPLVQSWVSGATVNHGMALVASTNSTWSSSESATTSWRPALAVCYTTGCQADTSSDPTNCGVCGHDCQGGACQDGVCQPLVLAADQPLPTAFGIDSIGVYWSVFVSGGGVYRVPLNGGPTTLVTAAGGAVLGLALDGGNVYTTSGYTGTVSQAPIAGGAATALVSGLGWPTGIVVDATDVYWSQDSGEVSSVPIGGGPVTILASGEPVPRPMAIDAANVYWVNLYGGGLMQLPKAGGTPVVLAGGVASTQIAVDATHVYYATASTVEKVPVTGGAAVVLASGQSSPFGVAVDATRVYWTNNGDGTIMAAPLGGGPAVTLAMGQTGASLIAVDGTGIYWSNAYWTPATGGTGSIVKLAK